jgi:hypothetical protein
MSSAPSPLFALACAKSSKPSKPSKASQVSKPSKKSSKTPEEFRKGTTEYTDKKKLLKLLRKKGVLVNETHTMAELLEFKRQSVISEREESKREEVEARERAELEDARAEQEMLVDNLLKQLFVIFFALCEERPRDSYTALVSPVSGTRVLCALWFGECQKELRNLVHVELSMMVETLTDTKCDLSWHHTSGETSRTCKARHEFLMSQTPEALTEAFERVKSAYSGLTLGLDVGRLRYSSHW